MNYEGLTNEEFLNLIFKMEDRLDYDYIEEAKRRREDIMSSLCQVLMEEKNYKMTDRSGWGIIHAVHILGILADQRAMDALLFASSNSDKYDIYWIWDALPECYLRIGLPAIPKLKAHIQKDIPKEEYSVDSEVSGLWNIWTTYPDAREDIEDYFLNLIKSPGNNYELRTNLIADMAQINRQDLRPLFEEYFETGEVDLFTLSMEDLGYFYDECSERPGFRRDLELFYSDEEIQKRQKLWKKEAAQKQYTDTEEFILENINKLGRNEPCPCGSGHKFKKCHLKWAEDERDKIREEEDDKKESMQARKTIELEMYYETLLRRFLAKKSKTSLFLEIKNKIIEVLKEPPGQLNILSHLKPILDQINFRDGNEMKSFINDLMEYYNSLAAQYIGHPRDEKLLH